MASSGLSRWLHAALSAACFSLVLHGCASRESVRAEQVVSERLKCPRGEIESGVHRETAKVREWYVGCNFIYARVHCTDTDCHPAPPEPPCIGNLPCFEEDPVTLEWRLPERSSR